MTYYPLNNTNNILIMDFPLVASPANLEYRVIIQDRNYSKCHFIPITEPHIPSTHFPTSNFEKLFSNDIIRIAEDGSQTLVYSPIRTQSSIAGILILEKNKTFGRTANKKRLLYKCIPDDTHLPPFLVPYDVKLGFSKSIVNKYIVFRFDSWNDRMPHGTIVETLGDVDNINVFYEYQLICKNIHASITEFSNATRDQLRKHTIDEYITRISTNESFNIHTISRDISVFSIDPIGSVDFDDAFSVRLNPVNGNTIMSIYISNVYVWLDALGLLNTAGACILRTSTIYLPDRKRPMLPSVLSDSLCSLQENQPRFALCMSVEITPNGILLTNTATFQNVLVYVSHNYTYESPSLLSDSNYHTILQITRQIRTAEEIHDSHDLVAFWMIQMNTICGSILANNRNGIFRTSTQPIVDPNSYQMIHKWMNVSSQYSRFAGESIEVMNHDVMNIQSYTHITSPIRRIVDLLNSMIFMEQLGIIRELSPNAHSFIQYWMGRIEHINTTMRSIRKVQANCELLCKITQQPELIHVSYTGIVFDKTTSISGVFSYTVYLEHFKLFSRVKTLTELDNYKTYTFKLFVFQDEENIRNKIRLLLEEQPSIV